MIKKGRNLTILGIETSCDETGVAVVKCSGGMKNPRFEILSNIISSQIKVHAPWGGVVPNLARREHIKNLPIVYEQALKKAGIKNPKKAIDVIAVTVGPGLEPALWTGIEFAKKLAQDLQKPVAAANHMEGHIMAALLPSTKPKAKNEKRKIQSPALALLVSGGHTELVFIKNWLQYKKIGQTLDDAAGEAFDKVGKMLGLEYPAGPKISKLAKDGNNEKFSFPRPMIKSKNLDFSFSGLKTSILYKLRELKENRLKYAKSDIAASFEEAVIEVLIKKTGDAIKKYGPKTLILGGGVAANTKLRTRFRKLASGPQSAIKLLLPHQNYTADNAAMVAASAYLHSLKNDFTDWKELEADANMSL